MFAKYYLEMAAPLADVKKAMLARSPEAWLPGIVEAGSDLENRLLTDVGFKVGGRRVDRRVEVEVGPSTPLGSGVVIPLSWRAASSESLFPKLEADLELAPLGPALTQLSVSARYEPPLAGLGRILDRTLLHRVAEAVIRDFTERVAETLRGRLAEPIPS